MGPGLTATGRYLLRLHMLGLPPRERCPGGWPFLGLGLVLSSLDRASNPARDDYVFRITVSISGILRHRDVISLVQPLRINVWPRFGGNCKQ